MSFRLTIACLVALVANGAAGEVVFRSGHSGEPDSLDPHKAMPGSATVVINDLFEGLLTLDAAGHPSAGAAQSWSVSADGLVWTFRLRDGLRWSDGTPLDAADFVYSFRRMADPATAASSMAASVDSIAGARDILSGNAPVESLGVSAPDSSTVVVEVDRPKPWLPSVMASPGFVPVPRHVIAEHGDSWSRPGVHVSNGAYRLDRWIPQDYVRVVRNQEFHAAGSLSIDAVHYYVVDDLNTGLRRFRAGDLHAMVNFPPDKLDWLRENMPEVLHLSPSLGLMLYAFNLERAPYDDVRVRRALSLAVDRRLLTQRIVRSGDTPAYGLLAPGLTGDAGPYPDPAESREEITGPGRLRCGQPA
jgi:oligopeptide transport system substrate-binding protein